MKKNKFDGVEFFLGKDDTYDCYDGYQMIEHAINKPQGEGGCCFSITDYWLSDGDGYPTRYDDTFVKVSVEVYECAMRMFRAVKENLWCINGEPIPADREIKVGDYIKCGGDFLHIISISPDKCLAESFYADSYGMDIYIDIDTFEDLDVTIEELKADGRLITKEVYEEALATAEAAIHQIKSYLKVQYENNRK